IVGAPTAERERANEEGTVRAETKTPPPMTGPLVRVHIVSSRKAYMYRRPAGSSEFSQACESPCDIDLPTGDTYKIGGSGITTSRAFRIAGALGQTGEIEIDGPSWVGIVGCGTATVVGGLTAYVGLIITAA